MICPNCEKEIEPNIPQCPNCGCHFPVSHMPKPVSIPEPEIEKQPEATESAAEQKCPECGKAVPLTARFCKWCGSPISKEKDAPQPVLNQTTNNEENTLSTKICGNCGGTIKVTASFCKWCGSPCNNKKENEE